MEPPDLPRPDTFEAKRKRLAEQIDQEWRTPRELGRLARVSHVTVLRNLRHERTQMRLVECAESPEGTLWRRRPDATQRLEIR